jgi:hypothetical protein
MTSSFRASCAVYKMLLFAYPGDVRRRFGSEMITTFSEQMRGEWEQKGVPGIVRVWRFALGEVFSVAVPLQLRSPIVIAASLSLLLSSALFVAVFHAATHMCSGE